MPRIDVHLTVDGVNINLDHPVTITCGNKNYFYAVFKLSDCWADIVPSAVFGSFGQKPYSVKTQRVEGDNLVYECVIPYEVLRGTTSFYVGLTGGDFLNTVPLTLKVNKGCYSDDPLYPIEDGDNIKYGPSTIVVDAKKLYSEPSVKDIAAAIFEKTGNEGPYTIGEMGDAIRDIYIPEEVEDGNHIAYSPDTQTDDKNKKYYEPDIKDIADALAEKTGLPGPYTVADMGDAVRGIYIPEEIEDGTKIAYGPATKADDKNKQYYEPDIKDISDAIREKNATLDSYKVSEMSTAIRNIEQGAALNVEYGLTPPSNTSKLWIKCEKPTNVTVSTNLGVGNSTMEGFPLLTVLPAAATDFGVATFGKKIYLFGGFSGTTKLNTINVFDTETNTITTLPTTLPTAGNYCKAVTIGTKIYVFVGVIGTSWDTYTRSTFIFDTETNEITQVGSTVKNTGVTFGVEAIGNKIYIFGGRTYSQASSSFDVFDVETLSTTRLSCYLPSKYYDAPSSAVVGTKIYIHNYEGFCVFDSENNTCTKIDVTGWYNTYDETFVTIGTKIYMFGGYHSSNILNSISVFDPSTNNRTTLSATMPTSHRRIGACFLGHNVYLFGGGSKNIYEFIVDTPLPNGDVWIQTDLLSNFFPLISGDTAIETGIKKVYVGNDDNVMEVAEAYLHNGSDWVLI